MKSTYTILIIIPLMFGWAAVSSAADIEDRSLKIALTVDADTQIEEAAKRVLAESSSHPLLKRLCGSSLPNELHTTESLLKGPVEVRAFDHLILIGLPEDPMIDRAWQNQAKRINGDGTR